MSDSANKLPVLTDEQRRANLEKATAVRKERKALLDLVRQGSVTFEQASADPRYWRIPVVRLLIAVPGIGKMKATQLQGLGHVPACDISLFRGGHIRLCRRHGSTPLSLAGEGAAASSPSYLIDSISRIGFHAFPTPHLFDSFPSFM